MVGAGLVSGWFSHALHTHTDQRIQSIVARGPGRAEALGQKLGVASLPSTIDQLLDDTNVDIVYIAVPHTLHAEIAVRALEAGKHVLVEKPLATTAADAERIFGVAERAGLLAMEGMWTRYQPKTIKLSELIDSGVFGGIQHAQSSIGVAMPDGMTADQRHLDPALAGGVLFEMGVYNVDFAIQHLGRPNDVDTIGTVGATGVEIEAELVLRTASAEANLFSTFRAEPPGFARLDGSNGSVTVQSSFVTSRELRWIVDGVAGGWSDPSDVVGTDALAWEAAAAAEYVASGLVASPVHPPAETIETIRIIEEARASLLSLAITP